MNISLHIKIIILYILILTFISSCHDDELNSFHPRLVEINNILSENPDSIYHLMDTMSMNDFDFSEDDKMYYLLLKASAQNKAFIPFTSKDDSIYSPAVKYFMEQGDSYLRMQACYVMGSIYRDLNCRIAAQEWYNKAISMADTTAGAKHLALLARVYVQNAKVSQYLVNIQQPVELFKIGARYALQAKDTIEWLQIRQEIACCIRKQKYPDSAVAAFSQLQPLLYEHKMNFNIFTKLFTNHFKLYGKNRS